MVCVPNRVKIWMELNAHVANLLQCIGHVISEFYVDFPRLGSNLYPVDHMWLGVETLPAVSNKFETKKFTIQNTTICKRQETGLLQILLWKSQTFVYCYECAQRAVSPLR